MPSMPGLRERWQEAFLQDQLCSLPSGQGLGERVAHPTGLLQESLGMDGGTRDSQRQAADSHWLYEPAPARLERHASVDYFQSVLRWAMDTFNMKKFKKIMKGLDWARFYDEYHEKVLDIPKMEKQIADLLGDDEIQKPQGIIPYVLTGDEHYLDLRAFPEKIKLAVWEKQDHKCAHCGKEFDIQLMEGDHITPWRDGGRTVVENCQMLCRECNRRKGSK